MKSFYRIRNVNQIQVFITPRPDFGGDERRRRRKKVLYLKACPKCQGDVELVIFPDSKTLQCLQCSFTVDSKESARRAMQEKPLTTIEAA